MQHTFFTHQTNFWPWIQVCQKRPVDQRWVRPSLPPCGLDILNALQRIVYLNKRVKTRVSNPRVLSQVTRCLSGRSWLYCNFPCSVQWQSSTKEKKTRTMTRTAYSTKCNSKKLVSLKITVYCIHLCTSRYPSPVVQQGTTVLLGVTERSLKYTVILKATDLV